MTTRTLFAKRINDHVVEIRERPEFSLRHMDIVVKWPNGAIAFETTVTLSERRAFAALPHLIAMATDIAKGEPTPPAAIVKKFAGHYPIERSIAA